MSSYNDSHVSRASGGIKKILVVDDEPDILQCYCYYLGDHFNVITATSGAEAKKYLNEKIDIVVLDHRLPDMSGIEVLKEINNALPAVPVIIVTAYGDEELAVKALRYGAKDYIKKPFNAPDLLQRIERCLSVKLPKRSGHEDSLTDPDCRNSIRAGSLHTHYKIQNAIKYISDNYSSKISLETVAAKACMSKYHFSRSFKKATGTTYQDHLNGCRIEKAKELLKNSNLPITEIAYAVGYADITNFERIFKRIAGLAPSQYKPHSSNQDDPAKNER